MNHSLLSSIRLLPHHQDTGAFFVALFQKIDKSVAQPTIVEEEATAKRPIAENTFNEEGYVSARTD